MRNVDYRPSFVDGIGSRAVFPQMLERAQMLLDGSLVSSVEEIAEAVRVLAAHNRVIAEGAGSGEVADFGPHYGLSFLDPDGLWVEVVWIKPGAPFDSTSTRANWRTVVPPESAS